MGKGKAHKLGGQVLGLHGATRAVRVPIGNDLLLFQVVQDGSEDLPGLLRRKRIGGGLEEEGATRQETRAPEK